MYISNLYNALEHSMQDIARAVMLTPLVVNLSWQYTPLILNTICSLSVFQDHFKSYFGSYTTYYSRTRSP